MKRLKYVFCIGVFTLIFGFFGCATTQEEMYMLYGPMRPQDFSDTTRQLDAMGVDYEVRNGNEIYISKKGAERIRAGYDRRLSEMNADVTIETGDK